MKSRQEIQQELLIAIRNEMVRQRKNWDDVAVMSPRKGKNSWTYREVYNSIKNDECLPESEFNQIDSMIRYYEWKEKQKKLGISEFIRDLKDIK